MQTLSEHRFRSIRKSINQIGLRNFQCTRCIYESFCILLKRKEVKQNIVNINTFWKFISIYAVSNQLQLKKKILRMLAQLFRKFFEHIAFSFYICNCECSVHFNVVVFCWEKISFLRLFEQTAHLTLFRPTGSTD